MLLSVLKEIHFSCKLTINFVISFSKPIYQVIINVYSNHHESIFIPFISPVKNIILGGLYCFFDNFNDVKINSVFLTNHDSNFRNKKSIVELSIKVYLNVWLPVRTIVAGFQ
jgi:hypothetical protein